MLKMIQHIFPPVVLRFHFFPSLIPSFPHCFRACVLLLVLQKRPPTLSPHPQGLLLPPPPPLSPPLCPINPFFSVRILHQKALSCSLSHPSLSISGTVSVYSLILNHESKIHAPETGMVGSGREGPSAGKSSPLPTKQWGERGSFTHWPPPLCTVPQSQLSLLLNSSRHLLTVSISSITPPKSGQCPKWEEQRS